jgi:hypothetical protein
MGKSIFYFGIFLATTILISSSVYIWEQYGMFEFGNSFFSQISSSFSGNDFKLAEQIPLGDQSLTISSELPPTTHSINPACVFDTTKTPSRQNILISEIAWMGTINSANDEWIELKNISDKLFNISGWQLVDKDEQIKIVFSAGTKIKASGFFVLGRGEERNDIPTDYLYSGNLRNSDEGLRLFDKDCNLIDEVLASKNWPAGDNKNQKTMERNFNDLSWHTSNIVGGTPKKENSTIITPTTLTFLTLPATSTTSTSLSSITTSTSLISSTSSASSVATTTITSTTPSTLPTICSQENLGAPIRLVLINELAWMGTSSDKATKEWIELKNNSGATINLNNWQLLNKGATIKIFFDTNDVLTPDGYYLLERTSDDAVPNVKADKIFTNAIKNSDESLRLFNEKCELVDEVLADIGTNKNWPAGDISSDYRTAERTDINSWHTYSGSSTNGIFGTPKTPNFAPVVQSVQSSASSASSSPPPSPVYYSLVINKTGTGSGIIISNPSGIDCGANCNEDYVSGISITLITTPSSNSSFGGWSGDCSGIGDCVITLNSNKSVTANFELVVSSPPSSPPSSPNNILISEIIAGVDGNADYEFIELYNPTSNSVDLTSWSIKRKSSSGAEYPLLVSSRLEGKIIPPGKYFLAVNEGGYNGQVAADVTWATSNNLAYTNNAVILYNASGEKIEEVSWIEIPKDQSYERISWDSNQFQIQTNPNPRNSQSN